MKCFVVVLAFATMVHGTQESQPYSFEDYTSWNQPLATERFSPNPTIKRQLFNLFGEGIPAAFLFSAAGAAAAIGLGSLKDAAIDNRMDSIERRIDGVDATDIAIKATADAAKTKADAAKTKADAAKTKADAACTQTTCTEIQKKADDACTKATCKTICGKVNMIVGIDAPAAQPATAGTSTSPSPDAVSSAIKPTGNYAMDDTYAVGLAPTEATGPVGGLSGYEATALAKSGVNGNALSIAGFNNFRLQVADAINTLDAKIRQISDLDALEC